VTRRPYRKAFKTFPPGTWVCLSDARWVRGVVLAVVARPDGIHHQARFEGYPGWYEDYYRDDDLVRLTSWPALEARYLEWVLRGER
jgi:hypothetical protein